MIDRETARASRLQGWNIRCNRCGDYGATWHGVRPGWGKLALCPLHRQEYDEAIAKAEAIIRDAQQVNFEQERRTAVVDSAGERVIRDLQRAHDKSHE